MKPDFTALSTGILIAILGMVLAGGFLGFLACRLL